VRVAELGPENPQNYGRFGSSVSVDGERVLVGSNLGVQAYGGGEPGLPWRRHERFGASVPTRVLVAGDRVFLAQPSGVREFHQPGAGAAWNSVTRVTTLSGPIAAAGGTLLVGSPAEDGLVGAVHVFTRGVEIDVLGLDQAADEEEVVIRGRGLDAVTRLLVGGVEQPIVRQSATELAVRAPRRDPGFADLALESPQGVFAMSGAWRAAPTLTAETTGPGGTLDFELVNGTTGAYVLSYGLRLNGAPVPVVDPPTWYGLWLDLAPGLWGRLAVDAFDSSGTSRPSFALPRLPGLAGLTVHFQAFCRRGLFGPGRYSFTNLASVTF
jgi:hypothetical protein